MKALYILIIATAIVSCQKSTDHSHHDDMGGTESDSTNTILYNQVMDIHDEVMPKMEDLYNMKKDLQGKLETASADDKVKLEQRIAKIDSASSLMMDWMHEFDPPADTADQEQARAYLEGEMEKVKRVKEAIDGVLVNN